MNLTITAAIEEQTTGVQIISMIGQNALWAFMNSEVGSEKIAFKIKVIANVINQAKPDHFQVKFSTLVVTRTAIGCCV